MGDRGSVSQYTEQEGLEIVGRVFNDPVEVSIMLTTSELWLIVSAIQMTVTHPGLGPKMVEWYNQLGRELQVVMDEIHPESANLLEEGWHRENDYVEGQQNG